MKFIDKANPRHSKVAVELYGEPHELERETGATRPVLNEA